MMYSITPDGVTAYDGGTDWKIVARCQTAYGNHVVDSAGRYIERPLANLAAWACWDTNPVFEPQVYDQAKETDSETWWGRFKRNHIIAPDPYEGR